MLRQDSPTLQELKDCDSVELCEKYDLGATTIWRLRKEAGLNVRKCGPPDPIELLSEEDKAYIAGLLDADGYISMKKKHNTRYPTVGIAQSDHEALEWMADKIDASAIYHSARKEGKTGWHRKQLIVRLRGKRAMILCRTILPYLKIKDKQARLILKCPYGIKGHVGEKKRSEVYRKREEIWQRVRKLNGRGQYANKD